MRYKIKRRRKIKQECIDLVTVVTTVIFCFENCCYIVDNSKCCGVAFPKAILALVPEVVAVKMIANLLKNGFFKLLQQKQLKTVSLWSPDFDLWVKFCQASTLCTSHKENIIRTRHSKFARCNQQLLILWSRNSGSARSCRITLVKSHFCHWLLVS